MWKKIKKKIKNIKIFLFRNCFSNTLNKNQKKVLLLPLWLTIFYLLFSIFIYVICPFEWVTYKPLLFYGLMFTYVFSFWYGYKNGIVKEIKVNYWTEEMTEKLIKIVSFLIIISCIVYILNLFREYGMNSLDFKKLWNQMKIGIFNPGLGYNLRVERLVNPPSEIIGGTIFTLFNYAWAFIELPIILFCTLYFSHLKSYAKFSTILYIFLVTLHYLSIGTNIKIFHVFLILELPLIIDVFQTAYKNKFNGKKAKVFALRLLIGIVFVGSYFTFTMISRGGINSYQDSSYNIGGITLKTEDSEKDEYNSQDSLTNEENKIVDSIEIADNEKVEEEGKVIPPILMKIWISGSNYLTQGYYGMNLALTEKWTPMFGVGNSMFLVDFISEHITDIDQYTYSKKIEHYGWNSDINWVSMYTWLANDFSFYGVIFVMGLIGYLLAIIYKDIFMTNNPFAKALLFYFILLLLFIPCNNQIAQSFSTLFSFIFLLFCWSCSKFGFVFKRKHRGEN